jgi:hypothetical protein
MGCLFNTVSNIGVLTCILPAGRLLPKTVPSFMTVAHGDLVGNDEIDKLFATADEVMRRRGVHFTETRQQLYRSVYEQTEAQRREVAPRRLLRSA